MSPADQNAFLDKLSEQMTILAAQTSTNSINLATLAEATNNLRTATERLWDSSDAQRIREERCRSEMRSELEDIRKDFNGAITSIRDSLSNVKYVAGALAVVGGIVGTVIGSQLN